MLIAESNNPAEFCDLVLSQLTKLTKLVTDQLSKLKADQAD